MHLILDIIAILLQVSWVLTRMPQSTSTNMRFPHQTQPTIMTAIDTGTDSNSIFSEHAVLLFPAKDGSQPCLACEQSLSRGLHIPSKSSRLTSGFEYPSILSTRNVSQEDWLRFTHEITESSKLSPSQWRTVFGVGLGTMAIGAMMLGIFGAVPAALAARQERVNQETRNLAKAMGLELSSFPRQMYEDSKKGRDTEESEKLLSYRIKRWNEAFFNPRGIMIRVDMPYNMSVGEDELDIVGQPSNVSVFSTPTQIDTDQKERYKASQRCRIVIIPLDQTHESAVSQTNNSIGS